MQYEYQYTPEEEKFVTFLSTFLKDFDLAKAKLFHIKHIEIDSTGCCWRIHYYSRAAIPGSIINQIIDQLKKRFQLKEILLVNGSGQEIKAGVSAGQTAPAEPKAAPIAADKAEGASLPEENTYPEQTEFIIEECDGSYLHEDDLPPLPPEPMDYEIGNPDPISGEIPCTAVSSYEEDPEYIKAYNNLYGDGKKDDDLIWGKKFKGNPRPIGDILEEENGVIIEGTFVKSLDKDSSFQDFIEKELRTGDVMLNFDVADDTNGIYLKLRFSKRDYEDPHKACKEFKNLLRPGMQLRIKGNVAPDRFMFDEMCMTPTGIMKAKKEERNDNAEVKRVELHCHTKMSKMDGVTGMEELVKQAVRFGHKALAITDHGVVQAFPFCYKALGGADLKLIFGMEGYLMDDGKFHSEDIDQEAGDPTQKTKKKQKSFHIIILAKNETGLRNLYKLVSISNLRYLKKRPLLPRQVIQQYREGLIIGSACEAGELYRAVLAGASEEQLEEIASFYDYLEIQPTGNNMFLVRENRCTVQDLENHNKKIIALGKKLGKLTVATCDVHFLNPEDATLRAILQAGQNYKDADQQPPLYFRTTEEMLVEFSYLGEELAYEVCVTNTNKIAAMVKKIKPVPDEDQLYSPFIPDVEETIEKMAYDKARDWYGDPLPPIVEERLKMELGCIIRNGFSVLYYIAHRLVKNSLEIGYLVGSRGSVGSSFAATMLDITEVNALKPHYRCPKCKHSEFFLNNEYDSGFDMPRKNCPHCGTEMVRDGHDIPFAVFLGFDGDKVPDIDLNFSEVAQHKAHEFTKELFGRDNVCRAGTLSTIATKTAIGYVIKYYEEKGIHLHPAKMAQIVAGFAGIKRTTGQHPGGIMVVPRNMDINYITPMNWPADEISNKTINITTHFDYHSINDRLVKLDILGHDDPTMIKKLEELIGYSSRTMPVGDPETMGIFVGTETLGVTPEQIFSDVGTFGIPECGTNFVRNMIFDVKPRNFSELVRVSGYSHGTNVWLNNAQDLIKAGTPVKETISTRDDIMTSLIARGVDPLMSFKTMEYVRKGKAAKKGLEPAMLEAMKAANVPEWYIQSCKTVEYLFPKAHAVAYVLMAYRIAYCKVHHPKAFYCAYFSKRAPDFDFGIAGKGKEYIKSYIKNVYQSSKKATATEKATVTYLELVNEMLERGFDFDNMDIYESDATEFKITEKGLRPPLSALGGVGAQAALTIAAAIRKAQELTGLERPLVAQDDLKQYIDMLPKDQYSSVGQGVITKLAEIGAFGDLPETSQVSLF